MKSRIHQVVLAALMVVTPITLEGKSCDSIAASAFGGWKSVASAPRDGTVVEMLETYGIAPWHGLFKWSKPTVTVPLGDGKVETYTFSKPSWVGVDDPSNGAEEDECLFWRPYKSTGAAYSDPTRGAQKSVAYWCLAAHRPYNKKKDRCE